MYKGKIMTKEELREAFKALGITQREFAKEIKRTESAVSDWFTGEQPVPQYVVALVEHKMKLKRIADALK